MRQVVHYAIGPVIGLLFAITASASSGPAVCSFSGECRPSTWEERFQDATYHGINDARAYFCANHSKTFSAQRWCRERGYEVQQDTPAPKPSTFATRHDQYEALLTCQDIAGSFKEDTESLARKLAGVPVKSLLLGYVGTAINVITADWKQSPASNVDDTVFKKIFDGVTDADSTSKYQGPILDCYVANVNAISTPACATQAKLIEAVGLTMKSQKTFADNFGTAIDLIIDEMGGPMLNEIPGGKTGRAAVKCAQALQSLK